MPRPTASVPAPERSDTQCVHVVIPTHTTRHLAPCLASMGAQERPPDTVVLTCDTDTPAIGELLDGLWPRVAASLARRGRPVPTLIHCERRHQGEARLNQVRNNGLRALGVVRALRDQDLVVVLDGDSLLDPAGIAGHARAAEHGYEVVIPYRVNLDQGRTADVSAETVLGMNNGSPDLFAGMVDAGALAMLRRRSRRYRRQLALRRWLGPLGLVKAHKPKLLGGHHAVSVRCLLAINGYDEGYVGYGYDDDDLARRLHALRPRARTLIAVQEIPAYHLWHPTRAPARPTDAPGYARFSRRNPPLIAEHGWRSPAPQPDPAWRIVAPS